ncbi:glycoside hydrolase domain-containing protein [Kitasatospora sp. Root187]|uniref:glycoside hydrolase domain-containing protein n=1 Tax=Kitasatospora sp. Root187 TaxID=1736486 RepID=UPI001F2507C8|nr:glycoside hydrolase domain-containing protein [Kitasatospora sp. Root187]
MSASPSAAGTTSPSPTQGQSATPAPPSVPRPQPGAVFSGLAFDTCTAPGLATMDTWRKNSPFGAAAVYIGGRNRGCAQPQLTSSWVKSVDTAGWKLVPLYVGAQAPCQSGRSPYRIDAANPAPQGAADGADAVAKASALGMRAGSALYLDVEAFNTGDAACADAVLGYLQGWTRAVHQKGYVAGTYAYATSSAAVIARAAQQGAPDMPAALWYAQYDGQADTAATFPFGSQWSGHRRGHQYLVNQKETHGGATVTVDRNAWDAPVAVIG